MVTSETRAVLSSSNLDAEREPNETIWEEMAFLLRQESNVQFNYVALMAAAGAVAAIGIWTSALHIVIGAMVIAPGFHPILRIPFGLIAGPRATAIGGVKSIGAGYLVMGLAGAATVLAARALQPGAPLGAHPLVVYW